MTGWVSACSGGDCVELMLLADGLIAIRDSKDRNRGALVFTKAEIAAFIAAAKNGGFDHLIEP